jgi:hypothetical protein
MAVENPGGQIVEERQLYSFALRMRLHRSRERYSAYYGAQRVRRFRPDQAQLGNKTVGMIYRHWSRFALDSSIENDVAKATGKKQINLAAGR